jgi:hypothetical protein
MEWRKRTEQRENDGSVKDGKWRKGRRIEQKQTDRAMGERRNIEYG